MYRQDIIKDLENAISNGRRIILFDSCDGDLLSRIANKIECSEGMEIWCNNDIYYGNTKLKVIKKEQMEAIVDLYYLYYFSDDIVMIGDNNQIGQLSNYFEQGLISKEEYIDIII